MTVTYDYTGKSVLVTGGTRGIGAGIAAAFRAAGADVTICGRTPPARAEHRFVRADVRVFEEVERLISSFDRLDVVINNAGGTPPAPVNGTSPRLHARIIELNLTAPLLVSQCAYPLLAESGGAIVMIGSASGTRPSPATSAYGAAKAGLHHLSRCLAAEWAPLVRINTVIVGLTTIQPTPTQAAPTQAAPTQAAPTCGASDPDWSDRDGPGRHEPEHHGAEHHGPEHHGPEHHGAEHHGAEHHGAEHHGAEHHGAEHHGAVRHGSDRHVSGRDESNRHGSDHYGGWSNLDGRAIPAGRMATPADVAQACLWLAAPGYVTGAEVRVDGGGEIPAWTHLVSGDAGG
ncbi:SDR family oxidoreductase [Nonomuraea sp. NPDC050404]|uniref:SDR family oxidoreductase n=1 Tax=Nonomuraea sp. NPDC050404 TaxID=3155783 RepID=UPI0033F61CB9